MIAAVPFAPAGPIDRLPGETSPEGTAEAAAGGTPRKAPGTMGAGTAIGPAPAAGSSGFTVAGVSGPVTTDPALATASAGFVAAGFGLAMGCGTGVSCENSDMAKSV